MTTNKKTFVTFVLDETGSMEQIKDDTIGGFNSYIKGLKEAAEEFIFTLIKFDSNRHEVVCKSLPIADVPKLTADTYRPGAMTPLIDACYKAIEATANKVAEQDVNVAVVIQTDGYENASTQYTNKDLARLIKEKSSQGWLFTFLGAGIDAFHQAGMMGIGVGNTMTYDMDKSAEAFTAAQAGTMRYAGTGMPMSANYTKGERMSTGGHMPPADETVKPGEIVEPETIKPKSIGTVISSSSKKEKDEKESLVEDITI
jgi:hypothetical protein